MSTENNITINITEADLALRTAFLQSPAILCWLIISLFSAVFNFCMSITIIKTKSLHTKCQLIMLSLCIAEIFYSLSYTATALKRYIFYLESLLIEVNQINCIAQYLHLEIFGRITNNLTLILALDRFLAVAFPIFYWSRSTTGYLWLVNTCNIVYSLILALISFYDANQELKALTCTAFSNKTQWYWYLTNVDSYLAVWGTVIIYFIALVILKTRLVILMKNSNLTESQCRQEKRRMEFDAFRSVLLILIVYLICRLPANFAVNILPFISNKDTAIILAPYFGLLLIMYSLSHFFVYLIVNKKFRNAFFKLFLFDTCWWYGKKNNNVIHVENEQVELN